MSFTIKPFAALAGALVAVLSLSACGASGPDAPTRNTKKVTDGAEVDSGAIKVRDLLLVAQPDGSAVLVATIINSADSADALTGITANGITGLIGNAPVVLATDKPAIFSGVSANAVAVIPSLNVQPGNRVPVILTFTGTPEIKIDAIVREQAGIYADVTSPVTANTLQPSGQKKPGTTK